MPRVSRFEVEFSIQSEPSRVWLATFSHAHAREVCTHKTPSGNPFCVIQECSHHDIKGRKLHPDLSKCPKVRLRMFCPEPKLETIPYHLGDGTLIPVRHITSVKLRYKGSSTYMSGVAPCSLSEPYNWKFGIHLALQRALEKARYCKLVKSICHHLDPTSKPLHANVDCPAPGPSRIVVMEKQPIYDEIMAAFWREIRVRPTSSGGGSNTGEVLEGTVIGVAMPSEARQAMMRAAGIVEVHQNALDMLSSRRDGVPHGLGAVEDTIPRPWGNGTYGAGAD